MLGDEKKTILTTLALFQLPPRGAHKHKSNSYNNVMQRAPTKQCHPRLAPKSAAAGPARHSILLEGYRGPSHTHTTFTPDKLLLHTCPPTYIHYPTSIQGAPTNMTTRTGPKSRHPQTRGRTTSMKPPGGSTYTYTYRGRTHNPPRQTCE